MTTLPDPVAAWLREPFQDTTPDVLAWCEERCAAVLPDVPTADTVPYLVALIRHTHTASEETREVLAAAQVFAGDRADAKDVVGAGTAYRPAPVGEWLAPDLSTLTLPPVPFDPTAPHPRILTGRGVEVRGSRRGTYVVGSFAPANGPKDGTYGRMWAQEALERADLWQRTAAPDMHPIGLIGTDTFSWSEVVAHKPFKVTTTDGATFIQRPEGAGRSIAGRDVTKPPRHKVTAVRYGGAVRVNLEVGAERWHWSAPEVEHVASGPMAHLAPVRVVKRYRTELPQGRRITIAPREEVRDKDGKVIYRSPILTGEVHRMPALVFIGHRPVKLRPRVTGKRGGSKAPRTVTATVAELPDVLAALVPTVRPDYRPRIKVGDAVVTLRPDRGFDVARKVDGASVRTRNIRKVDRVVALVS